MVVRGAALFCCLGCAAWKCGCPCVLGRLLRIFCAVLSVLQRFICAQLMRMGTCLALHPFILLAARPGPRTVRRMYAPLPRWRSGKRASGLTLDKQAKAASSCGCKLEHFCAAARNVIYFNTAGCSKQDLH